MPAILCDIGNVLATFDFSIAAHRLSSASPFPADTILQQLDDLKLPFENGDLTDSEFLAAAVERLQFAGTPEDFAAIWCGIFSANDAMRHTLQPLRGRIPLYLLSNTSGLHRDWLFRAFDVFQLFDDGVYSYSAHCSKPDAAIFQHAIDQLQLDPAHTFFIDDLPANIATAEQLGFVTHTYDFRQHPALHHHLTEWLSREATV